MLSMAVAAACNINMARENGFWIIVFNAFPCTSSNKYLTIRNTQGVPDTDTSINQWCCHGKIQFPSTILCSEADWGWITVNWSSGFYSLLPCTEIFFVWINSLFSSSEIQVGVSKNPYRPKLNRRYGDRPIHGGMHTQNRHLAYSLISIYQTII